MTTEPFLAALLVASAVLAAWFYARFPKLSPESERGITFGLVGSVLVFVSVPPAIMAVGRPLGAFAAAFLVALPGCTYLMLTGLWLMAYLRRAIAPFLK